MYTGSGHPDIIACSPEGKFLAYEVKRPGLPSKFTKEQIKKLTNYHKYSNLVGGGWDCIELIKCPRCNKITLGNACFYCNKVKF